MAWAAYRFREGAFVAVPAIADGDWLRVTDPDARDLERLVDLGIPASQLAHLADPAERPRARRFADGLLVVLHFPVAQPAGATVPYVTMPLSLVVTPRNVVTVTPAPAAFLDDIERGEIQLVPEETGVRFLLAVMRALAASYLAALAAIQRDVDGLEDLLRRSLRNQEVLELLRRQKSLVYFTTALDANELVLERLHKGSMLRWTAEDEEALEDVRVELRQATEMVAIAENILAEMMDAFASIVSNNLNAVMKVLTAATILIAVPTLIASLWGMNVQLPFAGRPWAFGALLAASTALVAALAVLFFHRRWL